MQKFVEIHSEWPLYSNAILAQLIFSENKGTYRSLSKISRAYFKLTRFLDVLIFEYFRVMLIFESGLFKSCTIFGHAYFQILDFWPRGFADAVLRTAYLLLFLLLENFFEFHEKSGHSLHC